MARSTDAAQQPARGFVPPQNDQERILMRHVEDLARVAAVRGIPRWSSFLSEREQALARAALNRAGCAADCWHFDGGFAQAERRVLCIHPPGEPAQSPVCCIRAESFVPPGAQPPAHRDYLGSLLALELRREALGDILLPPNTPGVAYLFALQQAAPLICSELRSAGRAPLRCSLQPAGQLAEFAPAERELRSATVSSPRLDAALAAMLRCSRGMAAELIAAGRVEINHVPAASAHAAIYEGDVFTVRGKGRYRLVSLPGKSKKGRDIITYFQY